MHQFIFDFPVINEFYEEDFIVSHSNFEACNALNMPNNWTEKRLLLIGEEGSGKSHLVRIFASRYKAIIIKNPVDFESLNYQYLIFEDIQDCSDETFLFHLINFAKNNDKFLLLTASIVNDYKLNDLRSRINATSKILIKSPDEILFKAVLYKNFFQRQIHLDQDVINYLSVRLNRGYKAIKDFVDFVDKYSLRKKRPITIPLIKEAIAASTSNIK
jgi:chromosomal replication initiation ATPase DnaA